MSAAWGRTEDTVTGLCLWPELDPRQFPWSVELTRRAGPVWRQITLSRHATKRQAMREMWRASASLPPEQYLAVREGV